eukprot:TRINITY_DN349_c0_g1_i1.p1 TRINITY_DN349_c0_g1~~TRINITY_DN349_c0_g1_i1.p1  ORF type:complete len:103 (+),score=18.37 TRINITY_DN349_c0_g1_i1:82-390(+)
MGKHTIVLVQFTPSRATRTFSDFETVSAAMDGIIGLFENKLRDLNPQVRLLRYELDDLHRYIDSLPDLICLIWEENIKGYVPCNKDWIKERMTRHLRKNVNN